MKLNKMILSSLALGFAINVHAAAPNINIKDYSAKVRDASVDLAKLAKNAKGNKDVVLADRNFKAIVEAFKVADKDQARIAQAIVDGKTNVVTALYASMAAKELIDNGQLEIRDMDQGISGIMRMASVSGKGNQLNANLKMTGEEMKDASAALKKKSEYTIDMLSWSKDDAETHVSVMKRTAEIYQAEKITAEEALVLAIMEVKQIDKDAAMKIVRKLRDCV